MRCTYRLVVVRPFVALQVLEYVANFSAPVGCVTYNCTFVCRPGECTSYSSTNFVLAGYVLLAHAPQRERDYQSFDQLAALGLPRLRCQRSPRSSPIPRLSRPGTTRHSQTPCADAEAQSRRRPSPNPHTHMNKEVGKLTMYLQCAGNLPPLGGGGREGGRG